MRFISCFVSGFGKLCNQAFDLNKDIIEIKAKNGSGKTTLAAFLESMLFGLEGSRSKSVEDNARLKYEPWQGGAFGGSLTFFHAGKTYRLERKFGKTPSADSVRLYDKNNAPCYDFGENISRLGELLLGVNRETYRKSAYIPQGGVESEGFPEDTKTRLIALLSTNSEKEAGAGGAIKRLEDAEKKLRAKRAPAKGKLDEIEGELERLNRAKAECERAAGEAREEKSHVRVLQAKLAEIKGEKDTSKKKKRRGVFLVIFLALFALGVLSLSKLPALALPIFALGVGFFTAFVVGKKQRSDHETDKERLIAELARREMQLENLEGQACAFADYQAEEERLTQEKARLEKRLAAIQAAKELLIRARSNMASCYLAPVEKKCKEYAQILSESESETLRLTAEGAPIIEENGSLKPLAHYSAGAKDLIGLCTRLALAEAAFEKSSPPVLILDDPLVNLDDETTRRAKRLIRTLSKKYQIVYFTCKTERSL
ncbi:MAG: hypothetical protein J6B56_02840 [Clostridia bacterium]|nr:hypothetical protein [Clostridia bacterium]